MLKVSEEEGSYVLRFYRWLFPLVYKSCFLFLVTFPGLIDTLFHGCQLEGSFYHCIWRGDKGPWYWNVISAYHRWLEHFIWHYICFVQSREAFKVRGNKHRHTNTHTHTHTHTHTYTHTNRHVTKLNRDLANLQHAEYFICFPHLVPPFALLLTVVSPTCIFIFIQIFFEMIRF